MLSLNLPDLKTATSKLFIQNTFDYFLVREITITTYNTFEISGKIQQDFFDQDELLNLRDPNYMDWKTLRPFCFSLIKGQKLPLSFHLVFSLDQDNTDRFLKQYHLEYTQSDIQGIFLHFRYENKKLSAVSSATLNLFTMDKSLDHAWDEMAIKLFKTYEIPVETPTHSS